ncbi:MAG: vacuolar sorting protein VPS33/slp1 [Cirrosporium novae-zelandiae]|nr:MAG: vacuolar sorting protein VPS33/slp1 [Cirrosporium novae-zelandiae]
MGSSSIQIQRDIILEAVRGTARGEWKVLVLDERTKKIVDNVVKEDDILNENVTNIELIEERRPMNKDMDAVYLLSPQPHIVDCLMADFERRRYRRTFLIWSSLLDPILRSRLDKSAMAREQIADFRILNIEFFPRESHLILLRDPWSFPILFHPACNNLVRRHIEELSQKVVSICVTLGEYPVIRYYRPRNPTHEASVLCSHLARFVQDELDQYAKYHQDFPPQSPRPRGALFITDRSMDVYSPLLHEFTYQAMAHDLLPLKDGDSVIYKTIINEGRPNQEEKEMEIGEKDKIWMENRHLHMKDLLEKLVADFNKFRAENPQFAETGDNANSLNNIKDMLAGLPQFQEGKEAYSLHLGMAQECMNMFQQHKLADLASLEQSIATGFDEDYKKPKNLADQMVRLLDDENITFPDRLRLIMLYLLYRDGLLAADIQKLLAHAQLPPQDSEVLHNFDLLGVRVEKPLNDKRPSPEPLFAKKQPPPIPEDGSALSRFEPVLKTMLENQLRGSLDQTIYPFTKPQIDALDGASFDNASQSSLRSAKPTWARARVSSNEPRQRIIVFMAGGATYAEARACYEISRSASKDVYLATSHMITPSLFLRQVGDLSVDKRRLDIPAERPPPRAPDHLFEREPEPQPAPVAQPSKPNTAAPPTAAMLAMNINQSNNNSANSPAPNGISHPSNSQQAAPAAATTSSGKFSKKGKDPDKKKHHFFKSKR